jgi:hypothetical protein
VTRAPAQRAQVVAALVLVAAATGCATRSASIDHRMLLPQAGARHALESTQFFVMPVSLAAPEPVFPELAEDALAIDLTVCAEVWLSEDGDVSRVVPFDVTVECAQTSTERALAYAQAVVEAMRGWEFTPAMICEFPPQSMDKRERGDCTGPEVVVRRVAVRLDYAFTFSLRNGRKRVGVARKLPVDAAPAAPAAR